MGIRFLCPNGHKLNVKSFLAGKRAICPDCGARVLVPFPDEQLPAEAIESRTATIVPAQAFATQPVYEPVDVSSTSAVIAVEPPSLAPPDLMPAVIPAAAVVGADEIPESIIAAVAPASEPDLPAGVAPDAAHIAHRQKAQRRQMLIAATLLITVVILAVVFVWVLRRSESPAPEPPAVAPATTQSLLRLRERNNASLADNRLDGIQNRTIGS